MSPTTFDRDGNTTDDADRMVSGCDSFDSCPVGERDPMYDEAPATPRCGGPVYEYGENVGCPGCRKCSPPDHECKPYGWGIERFEDPALEMANAAVREQMNRVYGAYALRRQYQGCFGRMEEECPLFWREERDRLWACLTRHDAKRLAQSERVWGRLCDECETHHEAVERYAAWATKKTGRMGK